MVGNQQLKVFHLSTEQFEIYQSRFSFLCTNQPDYKRGRLYPSLVLDDAATSTSTSFCLYLSNFGVASNKDVLRILGITHIINCTVDCPFATIEMEDTDIVVDIAEPSSVAPSASSASITTSSTTTLRVGGGGAREGREGGGIIEHLRVPVVDDRDQQICEYFDLAIKFIDDAIAVPLGNISSDTSCSGICSISGVISHSPNNSSPSPSPSPSPANVLVHCKHGQSRSATVLAAYLLARRGRLVASAEDAVAFLKTKRPKVGPNVGFLAQLKTFQESLQQPQLFK